jgi:hypothetical protein
MADVSVPQPQTQKPAASLPNAVVAAHPQRRQPEKRHVVSDYAGNSTAPKLKAFRQVYGSQLEPWPTEPVARPRLLNRQGVGHLRRQPRPLPPAPLLHGHRTFRIPPPVACAASRQAWNKKGGAAQNDARAENPSRPRPKPDEKR